MTTERRALVIDASAAIFLASAARPTPGIDRFDLVAPPNFPSERTSALAAAVYRGLLDEAVLDRLFERLESLTVEVVDGGRAHRRAALDLARSLGWAKTYDAEYVVLALERRCELFTTDLRLARGAGHLVAIRRPTDLAI